MTPADSVLTAMAVLVSTCPCAGDTLLSECDFTELNDTHIEVCQHIVWNVPELGCNQEVVLGWLYKGRLPSTARNYLSIEPFTVISVKRAWKCEADTCTVTICIYEDDTSWNYYQDRPMHIWSREEELAIRGVDR